MLAIGAVLYWRFSFGPQLMVEAIKRGDVERIGALANTGINPNSDVFLLEG